MTAVRFEIDADAHLAVITIDRPEARNAVNGEVATGIESAIDAIESDDRIWVAILTGTPPAFCAGADLKEVQAGRSNALRTKRGGLAGIVRRARTKPIIAAVEGAALAAGTEIVLACDLVVAGDTATFGLPEVRRSNVAGGGGLFRLGRRIPYAAATEWALTGDAFPARRAHDLGLVNVLVPFGEAVSGARDLARRITKNAPLAVQHSLGVLRDATYLPENEAWSRSNEAMRTIVQTQDFAEGVNAFIEKRSPLWTAT